MATKNRVVDLNPYSRKRRVVSESDMSEAEINWLLETAPALNTKRWQLVEGEDYTFSGFLEKFEIPREVGENWVNDGLLTVEDDIVSIPSAITLLEGATGKEEVDILKSRFELAGLQMLPARERLTELIEAYKGVRWFDEFMDAECSGGDVVPVRKWQRFDISGLARFFNTDEGTVKNLVDAGFIETGDVGSLVAFEKHLHGFEDGDLFVDDSKVIKSTAVSLAKKVFDYSVLKKINPFESYELKEGAKLIGVSVIKVASMVERFGGNVGEFSGYHLALAGVTNEIYGEEHIGLKEMKTIFGKNFDPEEVGFNPKGPYSIAEIYPFLDLIVEEVKNDPLSYMASEKSVEEKKAAPRRVEKDKTKPVGRTGVKKEIKKPKEERSRVVDDKYLDVLAQSVVGWISKGVERLGVEPGSRYKGQKAIELVGLPHYQLVSKISRRLIPNLAEGEYQRDGVNVEKLVACKKAIDLFADGTEKKSATIDEISEFFGVPVTAEQLIACGLNVKDGKCKRSDLRPLIGSVIAKAEEILNVTYVPSSDEELAARKPKRGARRDNVTCEIDRDYLIESLVDYFVEHVVGYARKHDLEYGRTCSVAEAASKTEFSVSMINTSIRRGNLTARKEGRAWVIDEMDLAVFSSTTKQARTPVLSREDISQYLGIGNDFNPEKMGLGFSDQKNFYRSRFGQVRDALANIAQESGKFDPAYSHTKKKLV